VSVSCSPEPTRAIARDVCATVLVPLRATDCRAPSKVDDLMDRFVVDMLPARDGDCLWIEYGPEDTPRRVLVDGGRQSAYGALAERFASLPRSQRRFELLVCTHVDADHVEGLLELIEDPALQVSFKDVWFNGFVHLCRRNGAEAFGARQGERLGEGIVNRGWTWNGAFGNRSVVVPDTGALPVKTLDGNMKITLISPSWEKLERLRPVWSAECKKHGLVPGIARAEQSSEGIERFGALSIAEIEKLAAAPFEKDTSAANGSSIAFILSYRGKSILLTGDAHVDIMNANLDRAGRGKPVALDACKLSHHGSKGTVSSELLAKIECGLFLVSTDGLQHDHPHREAIARVITSRAGSTRLVGNYRADNLLEWDVPRLRRHFNYTVEVPAEERNGTRRVPLL
jgi:beta-lactamase superfamily II metal-dependent hydrolase